MTIKEELKNIIFLEIEKLGLFYNNKKDNSFSSENIEILEPLQSKHGDYATNIAFVLASKTKNLPKEIAKKLINRFKRNNKIFKKVELAGTGFINFFLADTYLKERLAMIIKQKENYGNLLQKNPKKIQIEFISANPTGPLHLGHARNGFYGDVLARVLQRTGNNVECEFYVNDAKESTQIKEFGKTLLGKGSQYKSDYIKSKKKLIKNNIQDEGELGKLIAGEVLKDIKKTLKNAGIKFDKWFSEQNLYNNNAQKNLLEEFTKKELVYKKDGALWLKTSEYGDDKDRVIIRSSGDTTYFFSDILYHKNKIARGFQKIIDIWGADHQGHKKRMQAVMKILNYDGELVIPIIQMMHLKTKFGAKKMSKRAGTTVNLDWLIREVGKDVARFMMISSDIKSQMVFDLEIAKEKSLKNPVYYIQYALVRCYGIMRKLKTNDSQLVNTKEKQLKIEKGYLENKNVIGLVKELIKFPDIINEIAKNYEVHHLTTYSLNLAKKLHQFYKENKIIQNNERGIIINKSAFNLIKATKITLENIFETLGIEKVKKM